MLRACLVVAAARASQLNVQEAAVIVRGRAVSILAKDGCFTVAGTPCKVLRNGGGDDDALSMPAALPSVEVAAPPVRVDAALAADLLIAPMSSACAGREGLWHLLIECVATLADNFRSSTGKLPGVARPTALLFLDSTASAFCTFNEFVERYRWLIEALFTGGVYPSLECYAHSNNDLVYRGRVVSKLDGHGGAELELKRVGGVFPGVLPLIRERGLAALNITSPPPRTRLRHVLHLTRDDAGHRALVDDEALEAAFLGAGYATFDRCCDWGAADAARAAVRQVARCVEIKFRRPTPSTRRLRRSRKPTSSWACTARP